MSPLYGRWQRRAIERALKTRRVVLLVGSRQCGKTTLAGELVSENVAGSMGKGLWAAPFGVLWPRR